MEGTQLREIDALFRLVTDLIIQETERLGMDSITRKLNVETLLYADGSLLVSRSIMKSSTNTKTLMGVRRECNLDIDEGKRSARGY